MTIDLDELSRLEQAATPAGWMLKVVSAGAHGVERIAARAIVMGDTDPIDWRPEDYDLIVAMRNALPDLLREVRELRATKQQFEDYKRWMQEAVDGVRSALKGESVASTPSPEVSR